MNYKDYQHSRDMAWRILLDLHVTELPVKITDVCRQLGVTVKLYDPPDDNDGCSLILNGAPIILVRRDRHPPRQRFTTAHELGHILLGHVGQYPLVNREPQATDNPIEQAANVFAARLLAPACVLWGCGVRSAADIERLCHVSRQAAQYRMERMRLLYARDRFLTSPLEGAVYRQFEEYIKTHRVNRCSPATAPPSDE